MGWATITHPFHPLRGMRLEIIYCSSYKGEIFVLKDTSRHRTIAVPSDWTDRANPDPYHSLLDSSPILSLPHLLQLMDFLDVLNQAQYKKLKA